MIDGCTWPTSSRQVGRQTIVVAAVDQQGHLPVKQIRQVCDGIFHAIHGKRYMPTVKVATIQHAFAFRINDGVVVGAVEFVFDGVAQPWRRI